MSWEHWVQSIRTVIAILVPLGMLAGWFYHLHDLEQTAITDMQQRTARLEESQATIKEMQGAIKTMIEREAKDEERTARLEEKVVSIDSVGLERYAEAVSFQTEVRAGLLRLSDQLTQILTKDGRVR